MAADYAGDIDCRKAWEILESEPDAVLIDVRTVPEWQYVGMPELADLGKQTRFVSWKVYPEMQIDPGFVDKVEAQGIPREAPVLLICRSGQRSRDAAIALTARGFETCYNVAGGFEGPPDETGRRGTRDGWKVAGLPWRQN